MCIAATNSAGVAKKVDRLLIGFATDLPDLFFADFMRWPVHFKLGVAVSLIGPERRLLLALTWSRLGLKQTRLEVARMMRLTQSGALPPLIDAMRKVHSPLMVAPSCKRHPPNERTLLLDLRNSAAEIAEILSWYFLISVFGVWNVQTSDPSRLMTPPAMFSDRWRKYHTG
jgi:hypothetical protein